MKILHLANFYHSTSGGIKTYLDNKRKYFAQVGLPFRLVIPGEIDSVEQHDSAAVFYRVGANPAPFNPLYRLIWNLHAVHQIVKLEKPDILEVNDKFTLALLSYYYRKIAKSIPIVGFHHERLDVNLSLYLGNHFLVRQLHSLMMQGFCAAFDKIICASRFTAEEIEPYAPDKIEVINLGTNLDQFDADYADPQIHSRYAVDAEVLLLYVGRLAKEKNLGLLPLMMKYLEQRGVKARLVVAGVGVDAAILSESGRDDISLIGFIKDRKKLARLLASADAMVFPSVNEPYGLVPLEALASGLPVVCPDRGGVLEYSDSEAVRSVAPTPESFADAVIDLVNNGRDKLRVTARKHAEKFTWENTFEKQISLCEKMINHDADRANSR